MSSRKGAEMADPVLFAEERRQSILELVERRRKATVAELCQEFGVSSATIRNDLRELHRCGALVRTHGGAMLQTKTGLEPDSTQKQVQNLEAKRRIAEAALGLVEDGDTILLDTGTTTLELARLLHRRRNLTVVTNDLPIALTLEENQSINVVVMGGVLRRRFHCTTLSESAWSGTLAGLTVDRAFLGANCLSFNKGASTPDLSQAATKRLMVRMATSVVLLCDHSKFERRSFARFAEMEEIDAVVTDRIEPQERKALEAHGIKVLAPD
ncbi:MAG: DeoR/GlpR transcriptional regulator [Spirochaetales bacterium]|nr:DeoR/GlpR transcriptional regulator [Spirochaetales bacterium]